MFGAAVIYKALYTGLKLLRVHAVSLCGHPFKY